MKAAIGRQYDRVVKASYARTLRIHSMMRKLAIAIVVLGLIIPLAGCYPKLPPVNSSLLNLDGGFTLYVTNQSYAIKRVGISVEIDGELVVSDYFEVGTQHTFVPSVLSLTKGSHTIRAWSEKGDVDFSTEFELKNEIVGIVLFWYDPESVATPNRFIDFTMQEEPLIIQ